MERFQINVPSGEIDIIKKEIQDLIDANHSIDHENKIVTSLYPDLHFLQWGKDYGITNDDTKIYYDDLGNDYSSDCVMYKNETIPNTNVNSYRCIRQNVNELMKTITTLVIKGVEYKFVYLEEKCKEFTDLKSKLSHVEVAIQHEWENAVIKYAEDQGCAVELINNYFNAGLRIIRNEDDVFYIFPVSHQWRYKGSSKLIRTKGIVSFFETIKVVDNPQIKFGKYNGKHLKEVAESQFSYITFLSTLKDLDPALKGAVNKLIKEKQLC